MFRSLFGMCQTFICFYCLSMTFEWGVNRRQIMYHKNIDFILKQMTYESITLFRAITMFCKTDIIMQNILHIQYDIWEIFHKILTVPQNIVMAMNNVMSTIQG